MANPLEVAEGIQYQSTRGVVSRSLNVGKWTSAPVNASVNVYDESTGLEVTATVMPTNTVTAANCILDLSPLRSLTAGHTYKVVVNFSYGGNTEGPFHRVVCPKE